MRLNQRQWLILLIGCLALGTIGCAFLRSMPDAIAQSPHLSIPDQPIPNSPSTVASPTSPMPEVDSRLITAQTNFGFQLLAQLIQKDGTQNRMISPSSVAIALSMLYNGASGSTQQAMSEALQLQGLSLDELNQANAALKTSLENADPKVKLAIANSLWGDQEFSFNPNFLQRNQTYYNAEITNLDFASPNAVAQINQWVSQNTAGKIDQIIDRIDPQQVMFLINAVYFKGNWTTQFKPEETIDQPFHLLDGSQKQHPLMTQRGRYRYAETDQFQAIDLPYGDRQFSMLVFLPKPESNLDQFQANLTAENWNLWSQQFQQREGSIQLPKFKTEYERSLNDILQALGMDLIFDPNQADFSNLSDTATHVDEVKHKTYIEVNEEGTEAAAVTSIGIRTTSINPNPPFQMTVDRPFFYAIQDNQTGTLLFMGTVVNPE